MAKFQQKKVIRSHGGIAIDEIQSEGCQATDASAAAAAAAKKTLTSHLNSTAKISHSVENTQEKLSIKRVRQRRKRSEEERKINIFPETESE